MTYMGNIQPFCSILYSELKWDAKGLWPNICMLLIVIETEPQYSLSISFANIQRGMHSTSYRLQVCRHCFLASASEHKTLLGTSKAGYNTAGCVACCRGCIFVSLFTADDAQDCHSNLFKHCCYSSFESLCTRDRRWKELAKEQRGGDCAPDNHRSFGAHNSTLANLDLLFWKQRLHWHFRQKATKIDFCMLIQRMSLNNQKILFSQMSQYYVKYLAVWVQCKKHSKHRIHSVYPTKLML